MSQGLSNEWIEIKILRRQKVDFWQLFIGKCVKIIFIFTGDCVLWPQYFTHSVCTVFRVHAAYSEYMQRKLLNFDPLKLISGSSLVLKMYILFLQMYILIFYKQCFGSWSFGSARFWFQGSGSGSAKISGSTDPNQRGKISWFLNDSSSFSKKISEKIRNNLYPGPFFPVWIQDPDPYQN